MPELSPELRERADTAMRINAYITSAFAKVNPTHSINPNHIVAMALTCAILSAAVLVSSGAGDKGKEA